MTRAKFAHVLGVIAAASAALVLTAAGSAVAAVGARPPAAHKHGLPDGWDDVIARQEFGPGGGFLGPVPAAGFVVTVQVPAGAFASTVEITLTKPSASDLTEVARRVRARTIGGVGMRVQENGQPYTGKFLKPLVMTLRFSIIKPGCCRAVKFNGGNWVDAAATFTDGAVNMSIDGYTDFVVVGIPKSDRTATRRPIPGGWTGPG